MKFDLTRRDTEGWLTVGAENAPVQRPAPRLEWSDNTGRHSVTVERGLVIGAAPQCPVVLRDVKVSRLHAEVELREDGLWIRDLGSRNGTFVESLRIESARLQHGHRVRVGTTDILVMYEMAAHAELDDWPSDHFGPLLGSSQPMRQLFSTLARVASSEASVLIQGETGTGKELVARAIHEASPRATGPFVVVDCGAVSESLMDSELFGHAKGAFTGAHQRRIGAIESADGGTVFLDEIGELPLAMQPKLLRAVESGTIRRVGESEHRRVNVRFVCATHRDVLAMIGRGEFRDDLYFRLSVFPVRVPSLRERFDDLNLLVRQFAGDDAFSAIDPDLLVRLRARPWRGNVRELRNFVERVRTLGPRDAMSFFSDPDNTPGRVTELLARDTRLTEAALEPVAHDDLVAELANALEPAQSQAPSFDQSFRTFREQWTDYGEREFVRQMLERHGRNVAAAAASVGVDRSYLYRLMRKHGF